MLVATRKRSPMEMDRWSRFGFEILTLRTEGVFGLYALHFWSALKWPGSWTTLLL